MYATIALHSGIEIASEMVHFGPSPQGRGSYNETVRVRSCVSISFQRAMTLFDQVPRPLNCSKQSNMA
jgi:hypothetical protein